MEQPQLPKNVTRITAAESFSFACHPKVACFTDCCRQLELALTPYDILRLKRETDLDSSSFLEQYVIQEQEDEDVFPRFYLFFTFNSSNYLFKSCFYLWTIIGIVRNKCVVMLFFKTSIC